MDCLKSQNQFVNAAMFPGDQLSKMFRKIKIQHNSKTLILKYYYRWLCQVKLFDFNIPTIQN